MPESSTPPEWALPTRPDDFHYASLYLGRAARLRALQAEALRAAIADIPRNCSDPGVARVKLAWWREEAERVGRTQARHPLTRALSEGDDAAALAGAVAALAEGIDQTFQRPPQHDRAATLDQLGHAYGGMYRVMRPLGARWPDESGAVATLAGWLEYGRQLREARSMASVDLLPISAEVLAAGGIESADLVRPREPQAVAAVVSQEIAVTLTGLTDAAAAVAATDPGRRLYLTLVRLMQATLAEVAADGARVWFHKVELTPLRKLWLSWRARWAS